MAMSHNDKIIAILFDFLLCKRHHSILFFKSFSNISVVARGLTDTLCKWNNYVRVQPSIQSEHEFFSKNRYMPTFPFTVGFPGSDAQVNVTDKVVALGHLLAQRYEDIFRVRRPLGRRCLTIS